MPANTKPRKAAPSKQQPKAKIHWDELKQPVADCRAALSAMALEISSAVSPGTMLLTPSDNEEFHALKISTNKDLVELQTHFEDVVKHINPFFGRRVAENELMQLFNFGDTLMQILNSAMSVLQPDVQRLSSIRLRGEANHRARQQENAAKAE